ncbi:ef-hand calcium-binding site [Nannochloropsis oceanica]
MAEYYMHQSEERRRAELLTRKYEFEELLAMDENNDGSVDIMEFTIYLLKLCFRELDTDGSGQLTKEDFIEAVAEPERKAMLREMTRRATLRKTTTTPSPGMNRSVTKVGFDSPVQVQT